MWAVAYKSLLANRLRTFLAFLGLAIAITGVVALIAISDGLRYGIYESLGRIQGIQVLQKDAISPILSKVKVEYADIISRLPEVRVATPRIMVTARSIEGLSVMEREVSGTARGLLIGIDPESEQRIRGGGIYGSKILRGRFLKPFDRKGVLIGKSVADDFDKDVGSRIEINGEKFRVVGIWSTGTELLDASVIMHIDTVREMYGIAADTASAIYVDLKNPSEAERVARKIELHLDDVDAMTGTEWAEEISSVLSMLDAFFLVISAVAVLIGAIGVANTMLMSVFERMREFGVLRAIGWTRTDLMRLVMYESIILSVAAGVAGIFFGWLLTTAARDVVAITMVVQPSLIISAFLLAVFLGIAGGAYPAWRASRLDPIEVIRFG